MSTKLASSIAAGVLGPPGRQRTRASQSLLALTIYVLFAGLQHVEVMLGLIDPVESWWLGGAFVTGATLFYLLIRTGLNQRVASDPSLTLPQTVFGLLVSIASYAITGPARGAVMTLMVLILVFTMFSLRPTQSRALALFAFAMLGSVMWWRAANDPVRYPPGVEAIHLVFAAIVVAAVSVLAQRMGRMRDRLRSQKSELESALLRIGELATRDELTGLVNRRHMGALLQAEQARLQRGESQTMVALVDIDLFKRINDGHGHHAGDLVLQRFAEVGRQVLRSSDVLARWGGEEFLLMLPATTAEQAVLVVERMRESFARASFDGIAAGLKVTFSAGLSACDGALAPEQCIERADQAMYRAKSEGRNRTVLA